MYTDRYFVDRESGTYSDTCAAFGLAYVLSRVLQDAGKPPQVTLKDHGTTYLLQLAEPLTSQLVAKATYPHELLPFIQDEPHSGGASHYPLGKYFALLGSKTAENVNQINLEQAMQLEIPDDFSVFSIIRQLQASKPKGQSTGVWDRMASHLWSQRVYYPELLSIALAVYADTPNRIEVGRSAFASWRNMKAKTIKQLNELKKLDEIKRFETNDSLLAVFSPAWQKSINRAKPDSAENENQVGFWLPEYLKMVGMPRCALVISVESGHKTKRKYIEEDKKVYVLSPNLIDLQTHQAIIEAFRPGVRNPSSIKADITVLLNYTDAFLSYVQTFGRKQRFGKPSNAVSGFYCAYFKKSSNKPSALSLTNLPFLQLPAWVSFQSDLPTVEEIGRYQDIIKHQRDVLFYGYRDGGKFEEFVDENQSEGFNLLRNYREFLSGGSLSALIDFFAGFAALIMQQASRQKPGQQSTYKQFNLTEVRRLLLLMDSSLKEIINNDGFQAVARAVRLSTVTAQWLKATKKKKPQHEIRYGLAQDLKRKAPFKSEFTKAIMEFINQYQIENARFKERGGSKIHQVTTTHVRDLAALIDRCPGDSAEPVASLLLAYGYAYDDSRSEQEEELEATDGTVDHSEGAIS